MNILRRFFQNEKIINKDVGILEDRLLLIYVIVECIWLMIISGVSASIGLYLTSTVFISFLFFNLSLALAEYFFHNVNVLKWIYMIVTVIKIPLMWYIVGGNSSSAGAIFLLEIMFFAMTNRGISQIIFILISIITSGVISNLSGRFPNRFGGIEMNQMQHSVMSAIVGTSITLFIAFLVYYQKKEFNRENKLAMERDEQLKISNQMQKNFLANMSHEIRSPLGIVLGFNELIRKTDDLDKIKEYSGNIKAAGRTLQTVINDILDYSKIEAGKLDIIEYDYNLSAMIAELERDVQLRCDDKGLLFRVEKQGKIPEFLYGDQIRLKQCILNILTNAVKYTDSGDVIFKIACDGKDADGYNQLVFIVQDSGRGISEALIPKLFTSFQRLDEGQNRGIEGTGLGLAITKSLIDQMHGTIEVHSRVGEGSSFTIRIGQKDGSEQEIVEEQEAISVESLKGKHVLAVDDVDMNLVIIETILKYEGLQVSKAHSGKESIEMCEKEKFDVILMDHMMPEMDGIETYKQIKDHGLNTNTPVIMLTANAMTGAREEYLSYGMKGYVTKPINQQELFSQLLIACK